MSPIIDLQLRLRQLGTLRMGELTTRNGKTYPSSRDTWRVTTSDEKIAFQVAEKFGGTPTTWDSRSAESLVVDTDTDALPIAVVPGHAISQWWELWSGGGCVRRCDGHEELIGDGPCLCDPEQRECKPTTRLSVVVRGIDALGLFRLNTSGYYAAVELGGAVQFLEARTAKGEALKGWLRIEERRVIREGQTKVFKVPVLDVGYGIDRMLPAPNVDQLPNGYKPVALIESPAVTLEEGLQVATTQEVTRKRGPAFQRPKPDLEDEDAPATTKPIPAAPPTQVKDELGKITSGPGGQKETINKLWGVLSRGHHINAEQVYSAVALMRNIDMELMAEVIDGRKLNGDLSFAKLRDSLTFDEASNLIGRLGRLADHVKAEKP